jgi:putative oxygen-independent coproporphyrinogen III oxidase
MTPAGFQHVYVHIPFCAAKCPYCDFYSVPCVVDEPGGTDITEFFEAYDSAILEQSGGDGLMALCSGVETVYVGGGTPTVMGGRLVGLVRSLVSGYGLDDRAEITVEANPESVDPELLEALAGAGVTRMSVGVQSFDDAVLSTLGRVHDAEAAARAVARVVREGMDASLDLICGVPGQGMTSWRGTLAAAVDTGVGHISVYPLQIEEGTPMQESVRAGELPALDSEVAADMMLYAHAYLGERGLARYEVASYARPGKESRHNTVYWTGGPYLGLGAAAHSMCDISTAEAIGVLEAGTETTGRVRFSICDDVSAYVSDPATSLAEVEVLSARSAAVEDLMLGLRLVSGVRADGVDEAGLREVFSEMRDDGLVEHVEGRWRTTERGWLLGNEVYGRVWDAR